MSSPFLSGGVEPIAEVSADGEEPELQQDATKFIKKKQPSKKVKKGRITPHLLLLRLASTSIPSKNTAPRLRLNPEQIPDTDICSLSVTRCLIPLTAQSSVSWCRYIPLWLLLTVCTIGRVQIVVGART